MHEIVIISGKGGTGKTTLTAAFCALAADAVFCDADVDAADLHLLLQPTIKEQHEFIGGSKAVIVAERCNQCGVCRELCRFAAISTELMVDQILCEGCGVCVDLCPERAIDFPEQVCGHWFHSDTRFGPLVHARLGIAEENSGRLVHLVRKEAMQLAEEENKKLIITDGPPGIGCPVIAAIGGASLLLVVVEPTLSGRHDLERVLDLAAHFKVPARLLINKYDLNADMAQTIEAAASERGALCIGRIPFDPVFTRAMVQGQTIFEYAGAEEHQQELRIIWTRVLAALPKDSEQCLTLKMYT
ncbi:MAG: 4Fe-4S binding protein [Desulfobulbaceae bacterium]|nr:4Fe-4S binding protein [Desulfobulbaceae bacterium]